MQQVHATEKSISIILLTVIILREMVKNKTKRLQACRWAYNATERVENMTE